MVSVMCWDEIRTNVSDACDIGGDMPVRMEMTEGERVNIQVISMHKRSLTSSTVCLFFCYYIQFVSTPINVLGGQLISYSSLKYEDQK